MMIDTHTTSYHCLKSFTAISTNGESAGEADEVSKLVKQLETRLIGQQLVAEGKGIYAG